MAITYNALVTATFGWKPASDTAVKSYAHVAGSDLFLVDVARRESGTPNFTATYDGVSMSRLSQRVASQDVISLFRLSDPGNKTANIVVQNGGVVANGQNFYIMRIAGVDPTTPLGAVASNEVYKGGTNPDFYQAISLSSPDSIAIIVFTTGNGNETAISMNSPIVTPSSPVNHYVNNALDGAAPSSRLGYVIGGGSGSKIYTGGWTGGEGWSITAVFELLTGPVEEASIVPSALAHNRFHNLAA